MKGVKDAATRVVGLRGAHVPATGPDAAVADVRSGSASADRGGLRPVAGRRKNASAVLAATERRWRFELIGGGLVPVPRDDWIACGVCGSADVVVRCWRFHVRPGRPTVPWRCDVHVKCGECAAGWWHGVAVSWEVWANRPKPVGLRKLLMSGSSYEPAVWNGDRNNRKGQ